VIAIDDRHRRRDVVGDQLQAPFGGAGRDFRVAQRLLLPQRFGARIDQALDHRGQLPQRLALLGIELARRAVDHAQRAERVAAAGGQGHAGVEAHMRVAEHERVVAEALVGGRVVDLERIGLQDGVGAERVFARRFGIVDADAGLEPLAIAVDQG
jgi:hypothetical protein